MKLLVIIVNYRVAHLTIECLKTVAAEVRSVPGMRVTVCENGTGDDSAFRIRNAIEVNGWGDWCSLIAVTPNLGFTGGNNVVLRPALKAENAPEYVLLLNADTLVRPNAFKSLVDFMDAHPEVGVAGSRLENLDSTPQSSAFRFHSPWSEFDRALKLGIVSRLLKRWTVAPPAPNNICNVDWVSGASMMIRRKVLETVGLLDEGYYTYFDDIDFCFNAGKSGWAVAYVPDSRVVHLEGQTTGVSQKQLQRRPSYLFQARRRYFLKNHGKLYALLADTAVIFGLVLWRMRVLLGKRDSSPPHYLFDHIKHSVFVAGFQVAQVPNPALAGNIQVQELPTGDREQIL